MNIRFYLTLHKKMIYIGIVDDNLKILNTLSNRLNNLPNFEVLFTESNGVDFLEKNERSPKQHLT